MCKQINTRFFIDQKSITTLPNQAKSVIQAIDDFMLCQTTNVKLNKVTDNTFKLIHELLKYLILSGVDIEQANEKYNNNYNEKYDKEI